jgi:peptidoglycan/LPS O-acetylase OafA/YrhL
MGALRTLLAIGVVLGHCGTYGPAGGTTAVEAFFAISGFYMSLIFEPKYRGEWAPFLFARFMRLYPTYLVALIVAIAYYATAHALGVRTVFAEMLARSDDARLALFATLNLSVLFSDVLWFVSPLEIQGMALTPIWTLSLEVMFYLMCPVILRRRTASLVLLALALIAARCIAYRLGLNAPPWHARFFPFELLYFLFGVLAHRAYAAGFGTKAKSLIALAFSTVLFFNLLVRLFPLPTAYQQSDFWNSQALVAFVVLALPALFEASKDSVLDMSIGELSYPIYVLHYVFVEIFAFKSISAGYVGGMVMSLTLAHAIALYWFVQRPVDRFRQARAAPGYFLR